MHATLQNTHHWNLLCSSILLNILCTVWYHRMNTCSRSLTMTKSPWNKPSGIKTQVTNDIKSIFLSFKSYSYLNNKYRSVMVLCKTHTHKKRVGLPLARGRHFCQIMLTPFSFSELINGNSHVHVLQLKNLPNEEKLTFIITY